jgi:hypothetical protein
MIVHSHRPAAASTSIPNEVSRLIRTIQSSGLNGFSP